ncbi:hypothetical protein [Frateuria sp.]|uniref:hypothetical protein n=1 Tax=Frateuria sp. TaxID=2211372 RepID=UPI0017A3A24E|nr:hypothetical protein [Frateuria sp.]NUR21420.1 hypothetical protein [Frateuria sp.]
MNARALTLPILTAALLAALALAPAMAQTTPSDGAPTASDSHAAQQLAGKFDTFAGSGANAQALVEGLHSGSQVTLEGSSTGTGGTTSATQTTFQPATGPLGYGNVKIALSLAEASLAHAGVTNPTADEIAAALNGGKLTLADGTTLDLKGVLAERAAGEGWGQIAKGMGAKLGDVVRSPNASAHAAVKVEKVTFAQGHAADHPSAAEHAARADRPERPERPSRPEHPEHPDHSGRPGG